MGVLDSVCRGRVVPVGMSTYLGGDVGVSGRRRGGSVDWNRHLSLRTLGWSQSKILEVVEPAEMNFELRCFLT